MAAKAQKQAKKKEEEQRRSRESSPQTRSGQRLRPSSTADSQGAQRSDRPQGMATRGRAPVPPAAAPIRGTPAPARPSLQALQAAPQARAPFGQMPQRPATGPAPSTASAIQQALMRSSPRFAQAQPGQAPVTVPIPPPRMAQAAPITIPRPMAPTRPVNMEPLDIAPIPPLPPSPGNPIQENMAFAGPVQPGEPFAGRRIQAQAEPITIPPPSISTTGGAGGPVLPGEPGAGAAAPLPNLLGGEAEVDLMPFLQSMGVRQSLPPIRPNPPQRELNPLGTNTGTRIRRRTY